MGSDAEVQYLQFIWAEGLPSPEDIEVMNREIPAYDEEMKPRGVRVLGRELDLPSTAAAVRVRGGEPLVTDGPFAETKEFIAGFDVLDCADLDELIEVTAKNPISRFHPMELRPVVDEVRVTETVSAFDRGEDGGYSPFLLATWAPSVPAGLFDVEAMIQEVQAWRRELQAKGLYVLGTALGSAETATTLRVRDGETRLSSGSYGTTEEIITGVEVVNCENRDQAIELASGYPLARYHAIEVRPFYSE